MNFIQQTSMWMNMGKTPGTIVYVNECKCLSRQFGLQRLNWPWCFSNDYQQKAVNSSRPISKKWRLNRGKN